MINLNVNSPWVKFRNFTDKVTFHLWGYSCCIKENSNIDICRFMRQIILWFPLTILTYVGYYTLIFLLLSSIFEYGTYAGVLGLTEFILWAVAIAFIAIGIFLLIGGLTWSAKKVRGSTVLKSWAESISEKTCVMLKIKGNEND